MKSLLKLLTISLLLLPFACTEENEEPEFDQQLVIDIMDVNNEITQIEQDLDNPQALTNGRVKSGNICASITYNESTRIMLLDFGSGCTGPAGVNRAGKISIAFTGSQNDWQKKTMTFEGYQVNELTLNGDLSTSGLSINLAGNLQYTISASNLQVTYEDNKSLKLNSSAQTYEYINGNTPLDFNDDMLKVSGNSNGVNRDGVAFTTRNTEALVYTIACMTEYVFCPVSGKMEIGVSNATYNLDFGSGACDKQLNVTFGSFTKDIEL